MLSLERCLSHNVKGKEHEVRGRMRSMDDRRFDDHRNEQADRGLDLFMSIWPQFHT